MSEASTNLTARARQRTNEPRVAAPTKDDITMGDYTVNWPPFDTVYDDEFGTLDAGIYAVVGGQWPAARRFAESRLGDAATGLRLMIQATAIVSRRQAELAGGIESPAALLMFTFKRLVLGELKKHNRRRGLEDERQVELMPRTDDTADALDQKILIEQLYARMDAWKDELGATADACCSCLTSERGSVILCGPRSLLLDA
ncbi:MAG: hypothetical protein ACJ74J_07025 [Blastocatellia bacterium]